MWLIRVRPSRKRKNARSFFEHRKNNERRRQGTNNEKGDLPKDQLPTTEIQGAYVEKTQPTTMDVLKTALIGIALPNQWQATMNTDNIQYFKLDHDHSGLIKVVSIIKVESNLSWCVYADDKKVPSTCSILESLPPVISTPSDMATIIQSVSQAAICPGNPDEEFVTLCQTRMCTMKRTSGNKETIAFIDHNPVTDLMGQTRKCTIRRVDCDIICKREETFLYRCHSCQSYRSTLRASLSRHKSSSQIDRTGASSCTKYASLTPDEKDERIKNLHQSLKITKQQVKRLEDRVTKLIESEGVSLQPDDAEDVATVVNEVTQDVENRFPQGSPQRIFWEQQNRYNLAKDKRQMRWHPLVIRFALNLKYLSSSAYKAVRQSGIISLPSERTLADYTHWTHPHAGVQLEFIEQFRTMLLADSTNGLLHSIQSKVFSMDEMRIKSGLVFNKHTGCLIGFVDLGGANRDLEQAIRGDAEQNSTAILANQAFVFMVRAVFKPSLSIAVAHYFSSNLKGKFKHYTITL